MASTSCSTLTFKVTRQNPELIPPAKPTPHEFKPLSDIDDQEYLRFQIPIIHFYGGNGNPSMEGKDPVKVIRDAIAKALVFYYPFAGRLREYGGRKLVVECTGEGVMFIEADADATLQQFGNALSPPFPNVEELLYDVPGSAGIINCPLLLIQVTRLRCGGFIFALRLNHAMTDGAGIVQFLFAVSELAAGAQSPSVQPVWQRHLLNARQPPQVSYTHHEYDDTEGTLMPLHNLVRRSFFFNTSDIAALRHHLPPDLRRCSRSEIMAACIWRCRTKALSSYPIEEVRFVCIVNTRKRFNPPLPEGYYGNALVFPEAITTARNLLRNPLSYAVELVQEVKSTATEDYVKSVSDLMVIRGRPNIAVVRTWVLSDITRVGLREVDFGWGEAAYGGPAEAGVHGRGELSYFTAAKNNKGEEGVLLLISLPPNAMEVFAKEVEMMLKTINCSFNVSKL